MWKTKIKGLQDYEKLGIEFFADEDFLYVFDRKYPVGNELDEPLGVFSRHTKKNIIRKFLDGYIKLRDII